MQKPAPDGYYMLVLKDRQWPSVQTHLSAQEIKLSMTDYKWFRMDEEFFTAKKHDGRIEHYMWHNLLYFECVPNSKQYVMDLMAYRLLCDHTWVENETVEDYSGVTHHHYHCAKECGATKNDDEVVLDATCADMRGDR